MAKSTSKKRLDEIELHLTPKEWAIRLAKEMREQPSEADFLKTIARREYRESPWIEPFFKLKQQARACCPGKRPEDINKLIQQNRKLRTEFQALKRLIYKINDIITNKAETIVLKVALKVSTLQTLILKDALSRTAKRAAACIERKTDADAKNQPMEELSAHEDARLPSLIEQLANDLVMLLMDIFAHEIAVQMVQDQYFDAHPILFRDVEEKLIDAIKATTDAVETFNAYLKVRSELFEASSNHEDERKVAALGERTGHLIINIEMIRNRASLVNLHELHGWMKTSRELATVDILRESREHEAYLWRTFRESVGA